MLGNISKELRLEVDFIPPETMKLITQEVAKDIAGEEDEDTREFYRELVQDQRESEFLLMRWHKEKHSPQLVLYMGSGYDVIPKHVFGENKVVHLSMEDYLIDKNTGTKDKRYFPRLGSGVKVVGNAAKAPFKHQSFNTIFIQDMTPESIDRFGGETGRLLKKEGRVILSKSLFTSDKFKNQLRFFGTSSDYEKGLVPPRLNQRGVSESEYFVFKKHPLSFA